MTSQTHRVLIVGTGSIGERHLRCFSKTGRAHVGFVEINDQQAARILAEYPHVVRVSSFNDVGDWTAAVVATPAHLHVQQAIDLLTQRLHVLIEKPVSVSVERLDELIHVTESSNRVAAVAYVHRTNPVFQMMKACLLSGEVGRPLQLVAVCGQPFPFYRPAYANTYYARREHGGGAVQDALTHIINLGESLLGPVSSLVADVAHLAVPEVEVEDTVHVLARHQDVLANYSLNQHQAPNELTITVVCERGTLRFEGHRSRWMMMKEPSGTWEEFLVPSDDRDAPFLRQANNFLDSIEDTARPYCSLEEGIATLRTNLAILDSSSQRCWKELT